MVKKIVIGLVVLVLLGAGAYIIWKRYVDKVETSMPTTINEQKKASRELGRQNPLEGKKFYVDTSRQVVQLASQYAEQGNQDDAALLRKIANQPGTTWLVGPSESDPRADSDIQRVARTSAEAAEADTTPVYQLYAIPGRDACAEFSKGGFATDKDYLAWIDRILNELKTPAVFTVEADAIGHTIRTDCVNEIEKAARLALLNKTIDTLSKSPKAIAVYLDAGHSEWFPDASVLVEPLKKSGVNKASGIVVNVSNFVATPAITAWSKQLLSELDDPSLGVVIDTSRSGKGSVDSSIQGDARWCNPSGRGLGNVPTTAVKDDHVDAYLWIKIPGESDGSCFGYPSAGTFVPAIALELARNAAN